MFKFPQTKPVETITVMINGIAVDVPPGITVAAAVLTQHIPFTRTTPVSNSPRAPFCMMGVCYECLMVIDGKANMRSCQQIVCEGMNIECQQGVGSGL